MNNGNDMTLSGFSIRNVPDIRHFDVNSYLINRIVDVYNNRCPYGGYWDVDYIVRYTNDFFNDPDYRSANSYGINSIDVVIDWIVGGLISDS